MSSSALPFRPAVVEWFEQTFPAPTAVQRAGWAAITQGQSALLLAPTGSGKTLAAFLAAIDGCMFLPDPGPKQRLRVLYVSPLKALAADVEKNLRLPIAGIAAVCRRSGIEHRLPQLALRSGDTPARERARFGKSAPDILITTPESLYLVLTSAAREQLRSVQTVIVDEIHALAGSKRGAHLALSLERLEALRRSEAPLQRIGLSATQRPLSEVARLLGGFLDGRARPVQIVDTAEPKRLELRVELAEPSAGMAGDGRQPSAWNAIHPRLVELVRAHRSTMIFVNNRRLAERLAAAVNELAGEELALAHHGSVAAARRAEIEDGLKRGELRAIVATSSLELGIDMGEVDLVVQIESPPSVAAGLQRIGRAGHSVGAASKGVVLPKLRGELLSCAAATAAMSQGAVEASAYPRNPLDVLAQQIVATLAMDPLSVDALFALVRGAAPFAELSRASFEGVLDMLSGRYPDQDFAGLRARVVWNRVSGQLRAHESARRIAVVNGGTIPDRGLYGVFLAGAGRTVRVGELDEEMVFESQPGDVFLLGASSWRIEEITSDRVLVSPAHGEPGKMPFWHGDRPGRPFEFGQKIGRLGRELVDQPRARAEQRLVERHGFEPRAARALLDHLHEQLDRTGVLPSDETLVVEHFIDELGQRRSCLLSPYGSRVHAPWAMALLAAAERSGWPKLDLIWSDDGMVLRWPDSHETPGQDWFALPPEELGDRVAEGLANTALFGARFRENAARALLLPRRTPGRRSPLWLQRKRAADLLAVAARYPSFPMVLETFRDCLRDVFDVPALERLLGDVRSGRVRLVSVETSSPSPFAAALSFSYVANFIYDADAPLAERRAQALVLDHARLRELLGEAELRELLDPEQLALVEQRVGRLEPGSIKSPDSLHDALRELGPSSRDELARRVLPGAPLEHWTEELIREHRAFWTEIGGRSELVAVEDAAALASALAIAVPADLPPSLTEPAPDALAGLVLRHARSHGPFSAQALAERFALTLPAAHELLARLEAEGRLLGGQFRPGARGREWCDPDVLRSIKQRSLAKLRRQVEPVEPAVFARFAGEWHSLARPRRGTDGLLACIEQLAGAPLVCSALEQDVLPLRVAGYSNALLDALAAAGEVVWRGIEPLGASDARIALYPADQYPLLAPAVTPAASELAARIRDLLARRGASFFWEIAAETGAFSGDLVKALWELVYAGELTNDTLAPLRSLLQSAGRSATARGRHGRRAGPPGTEGRWSLLPPRAASDTARAAALATSLLERHGIVTREAVQAEGIAGGFGSVYPVLKVMEQAGRVRRGYFVAGLGAAQFAAPGADERLRLLRDGNARSDQRTAAGTLVLAATDPAQPYGAALPWPDREPRPMRAAGALVVLDAGQPIAYLARGGNALYTSLPADRTEREASALRLAAALAELVQRGRRRALLIGTVDDVPGAASELAATFGRQGFVATSRGLFLRPVRANRPAPAIT